MTNPPNNKMMGGPGKSHIISVKLGPEGEHVSEQRYATGPQDTSSMSDEQFRALMREEMLSILQEDGWEPVKPTFLSCAKCQAFRGNRCRMKAERQPKRTPADGCFEGLPNGASGD